MRLPATLIAVVAFLFSGTIGCGPGGQGHAHFLGGRLKYIYQEWKSQGSPGAFEPTNLVYNVGTTNQFYMFTKRIDVEGVSYHCRFAVRDPHRFLKPGVLAISDEGVILWVGDDGEIDVAPDKKWLWNK